MTGNKSALHWMPEDDKKNCAEETLAESRAASKCSGTLCDLLKSSNEKAHRKLESVIDVMNPDMTIQDYSTLIMRFYGYIAPWEDHLRRSLPGSLTTLFASRFKTAWLLKDLQILREATIVRKECVTAIAFPFCAKLPDLSTPARLLGSAYVIEGSSLGSRIIAGHLAQHFGAGNDVPRHYFTCYGAETGRMWKHYLSMMTSIIPEERYPDALNAAAQTFDSLNEWFSEIKRPSVNCHA